VATRDEQERRATYDARYQSAILDAYLQIEIEAVGSDYGNNGFTTVAQTDRLLDALALGSDDRLLDVGSGAGWPGLYLAKRTGCHVVVSDLTVPGMRQAAQRALADGLGDNARVVVASARHLPFRPDSFDAMVHTDVLC
jgi:cyclopropane fatty-acyl-phospholipid synthase-like methyltransferase